MNSEITTIVVDDRIRYLQRTCKCPTTEIRRNRDAIGRVFYQRQCLTCYRTSSPVKATSANGREEWIVALDWLTESRLSAEKQRMEQYERDRQWWERYDAYLQTPAWKEKRNKVLERDNYMCHGCKARRASQAHHLTYAHVMHEFLFELVSVCKECHELLHNPDERGRQRNLPEAKL